MHELPSVLWKRNCVKANLRRKIPSTLKSKKPIAQLAACKLAEGDVDFPDALFSVTGTRLNTAYPLQRNHSQWRRPDNKASNYNQHCCPPTLFLSAAKFTLQNCMGVRGGEGLSTTYKKKSCPVWCLQLQLSSTARSELKQESKCQAPPPFSWGKIHLFSQLSGQNQIKAIRGV